MELETKRLHLRPWRETDGEALYLLARDPLVGPAAGWPVHTDVENSRAVIRTALSGAETYAVCLKESGAPVGSIGLLLGEELQHSKVMGLNDGELGYWIGVPYWGRGLIPEAAEAMLARGFLDLGLDTVWCGYYDGNEKSRRVQEKCGFTYHHTEPDKPCPLLNCTRTEHYTCLTYGQWLLRHGREGSRKER